MWSYKIAYVEKKVRSHHHRDYGRCFAWFVLYRTNKQIKKENLKYTYIVDLFPFFGVCILQITDYWNFYFVSILLTFLEYSLSETSQGVLSGLLDVFDKSSFLLISEVIWLQSIEEVVVLLLQTLQIEIIVHNR